ncbi:hypothetical protein BsWGS_17980 [Bradybaena similaris]
MRRIRSMFSRDTSAMSSTDVSPSASPSPSPTKKENPRNVPSPQLSPAPHRQRSATIDTSSCCRPTGRLTRQRDVNHNNTITTSSSTSVKTTFVLSTSSPQRSDSLLSSTSSSATEDSTLLMPHQRRASSSSSWRTSIFNRVCTPQHSFEIGDEGAHADGKSHSTAEIRAMWKKLVLESLLLIRLEKENHSIRAMQEKGGATLSRKLDYQELTPCLKEITSVWEQMLSLPDEDQVGEDLIGDRGKTIPKTKLLEYVMKGVPRTLRGQVWLLLMQQQQIRTAVPGAAHESAAYEELLKQFTTHQHAILIDLGRTFPKHPYFSKSLGAGQLQLFNLLKAYSLLDQEVGYCQGLSFIVGMLLMHMEEISAFHVLKYLMNDLGLREQYRPNMKALQLKLYQLTRLLHDRYKDVYEHLESHEISPSLYAAPWFLTMFASQFPLGFVARVFDMVFIQGTDALFKVALTLIGSHRALMLQCASFESIVDFLKVTLPEMVQVQMERIINQAFELDIDRELQAYLVEYQVLSEEVAYPWPRLRCHSRSEEESHTERQEDTESPPAGSSNQRSCALMERRRSSADVELIYQLENQNRTLNNKNTELSEKLQDAHYQRRSCEHSLVTQQIEMDKLKSHIRALELERAALLTAVAQLRKLVPRESLQRVHLSLTTTSSSTTTAATTTPAHSTSDTRRDPQGRVYLGQSDADTHWKLNTPGSLDVLASGQLISVADLGSPDGDDPSVHVTFTDSSPSHTLHTQEAHQTNREVNLASCEHKMPLSRVRSEHSCSDTRVDRQNPSSLATSSLHGTSLTSRSSPSSSSSSSSSSAHSISKQDLRQQWTTHSTASAKP